MNYLELVQALHSRCGAGGNQPAALTNLRGEALRLKNWIADADSAIQHKYIDWRFLWVQTSLNTVADQRDYTLASDLGMVDRKAVFMEEELILCEGYHEVKTHYPQSTSSMPTNAILMPNGQMRFEPPPDDIYTVRYDYYKVPEVLTDYDDISDIPARYHMVIVGLAMTYYADYENAPDVRSGGEALITQFMGPLESDQLPGDRYLHNLAEGGDMVIEVE